MPHIALGKFELAANVTANGTAKDPVFVTSGLRHKIASHSTNDRYTFLFSTPGADCMRAGPGEGTQMQPHQTGNAGGRAEER